MRNDVREANPEASFTELGKLIGAKWSAMSDEDKTPYEDKAKEAKEECVARILHSLTAPRID